MKAYISTLDRDFQSTEPCQNPLIETVELTLQGFVDFMSKKAQSKSSVFEDIEVPNRLVDSGMDLYWTRQGTLLLPRRSGVTTLLAYKALYAALYSPYQPIVVMDNEIHKHYMESALVREYNFLNLAVDRYSFGELKNHNLRFIDIRSKLDVRVVTKDNLNTVRGLRREKIVLCDSIMFSMPDDALMNSKPFRDLDLLFSLVAESVEAIAIESASGRSRELFTSFA